MATADELIQQAQTAQTDAELDAIRAQADGRVTVMRAVDDRRAALTRQGESKVSETNHETHPQSPRSASRRPRAK